MNMYFIGDSMINLLPNELYDILKPIIGDISEIRLRVGKPIRYQVNGEYHSVYSDDEIVLCDMTYVEHVLAVATTRSMYAYNDKISRGYIAYKGGIRIGIAGEGVEDEKHIVTIKNVRYINIRIPHEIKGIAQPIIDKINDPRSNIIIVSPPGVGKTTMLRDYVRIISNKGCNVCLIDEKQELTGMHKGKCLLDLGTNTDVISGISKEKAYEMAVRNMSPDVIATDEIFGEREMSAIEDIVRSGVSIVATIHAKNRELLQNSNYFRIINLFNWVITLDLACDNRIKSIEKIR